MKEQMPTQITVLRSGSAENSPSRLTNIPVLFSETSIPFEARTEQAGPPDYQIAAGGPISEGTVLYGFLRRVITDKEATQHNENPEITDRGRSAYMPPAITGHLNIARGQIMPDTTALTYVSGKQTYSDLKEQNEQIEHDRTSRLPKGTKLRRARAAWNAQLQNPPSEQH
jgi:hypothetical protein